MSLDFKEQTQLYRTYIDNYLDSECFQYNDQPQAKLFESMRYSLLAGGKRLRPIFVFEFCRMCGGDWKDATPFATAVEMIHTYSLIHDDLPCMDNDDYRRGRLTNHKVYGEANVEPKIIVRAVDILSECAGELGMVGGQMLDMDSESRQCTEQEVVDIQSRKTGALIRAACMLGVLAGNGTEQQLTAAAAFSEHLGLAFQIRDDMLDVIGNAEELGKATGVDAIKNTFVQLYGIVKCDQLVREHTEMAIEELSVFEDTLYTKELAVSLTSRKT